VENTDEIDEMDENCPLEERAVDGVVKPADWSTSDELPLPPEKKGSD
jgi:hypothetical protein